MPSNYLLDNPVALSCYLRGELPTTDVVTRSLFVEEWRDNSKLPDHFLKNRRDYVLKRSGNPSKNETLAEVILHALEYLGERYLQWMQGRLHVRENLFGEWQDLLSTVSPLLVQAYMVYRHAGPVPKDAYLKEEYIKRWLIPNFRYTALPYPSDPLVEGLIRREGLIEMHCHLTGSTEADYVCLDAVAWPDAFYRKIEEPWKAGSWEGEYVREQFEQIEPGLSPYDVWKRLCAARRIREKISDHLFSDREKDAITTNSVTAITSGTGLDEADLSSPRHPAEAHLWPAKKHGELVLEAGYLTTLFAKLEAGNEALAHAFYFTLLTNALITKLTVQQVDQFGFDQFQKITLNEARTLSEEEFKRRFQQLDVTTAGDIGYFEGRFSPKTSPDKISKLMRTINKGFKGFKKEAEPTNRMELGLVCHFIKRPESYDGAGCRQHPLRTSVAVSARALIKACDPIAAPDLHKLLVGFDAASNELQAPPEVFAPVYRQLRRAGFHRCTYHVGEDFVHLLSGIRAIYEAIRFLGLSSGNRIGHGTAVGIDPDVWRDRVGDKVYVAQGDYLDDLVFAYYRLLELPGFHHLSPKLTERIQSLSKTVYGEVCSPQNLWKAWSFRNIDPLIAFDPYRQVHMLDPRERDEELNLLKQKDEFPDAWHLFCYYHGQVKSLSEVRQEWEKKVEVETDLIPADALRELQEQQLREMVEARIAIESMPTSNLRIGFYNDFAEHHIFRWLGISSKTGARPLVCLGSDDPGIFATSIRAEYYHVYRVLIRKFDYSPNQALAVLDDLLRNADLLRFVNDTPVVKDKSSDSREPRQTR